MKKDKNLKRNFLILSLLITFNTASAQSKLNKKVPIKKELLSNEDAIILKALETAVEVQDPIMQGKSDVIADDGMRADENKEELDWTINAPPDVSFNPIQCHKFKSYPVLIDTCEGELCGETPYNRAIKDAPLFKSPFVSKNNNLIKRCEPFTDFLEVTKLVKPGKAYVNRHVKLKNGKILKKYDLLDIVLDRGEGKYFACMDDKIMLVEIPNSEKFPIITVVVKPQTENWVKIKTGKPTRSYYVQRQEQFYVRKGYYDPENICPEDNPCLKEIAPVNEKMIVKAGYRFNRLCSTSKGKICSKYAPSKCPSLIDLESKLMSLETANDFKIEVSTNVCLKKWGGVFSYKCEKYNHRFQYPFECTKKKVVDNKSKVAHYKVECQLK